ncbi:unnamed protein product [Brachionus calyciflorus]|uniref:Peptidase S1 domain-containing protein n=1 Tax=Brachionus calyciflorus TaxID=104777 RepID=A0A813MK86_9BILA|nr:unnamed protein product [Brachionus calyciflorus]
MRKKTYKLSEHEKSQNRVDIFRTVKTSPNNQQPIFSTINSLPVSYDNPSFISSSLAVNQNIRRPGVWTVPDTDVNSIDSRERRNFYKKNVPHQLESKSKKPRIVAVVVSILIVVVIIVVVGVLLGIFLRPKLSPICSPECTNNRYCVKSKSNDTEPTCECKPGYLENNLKKCNKNFCYLNYFPFSYINTLPNSSFQPIDYESKFTRPFCCPTETQLTNSCCGVSRKSKNLMKSLRIIGGETIEEGVFPWVVYVTQVFRLTPTSPLRMIKNCSGTLINENYVLTAAHCLIFDLNFNSEFRNLESIVQIFYGFVDKSVILNPFLNSNYQRRVFKIQIHPDFNPSTFENDIALIKLDVPIQRSEFVDYICLFNYDNTDLLVSSSKLYLAGWGNINKDSTRPIYPNKLNYVDVKTFSMEDCKYFLDSELHYLLNSSTKVCAGYDVTVGKDSCDQDSGGPLMVELNSQWFIYGIVSFGSYPICAEGPAIYTRVSFYYNWVMNSIR